MLTLLWSLPQAKTTTTITSLSRPLAEATYSNHASQHDKDNTEEQDPSNLLPPELQEFADTFSGRAANTLPPYRKGVDHYIELEPDK
jgi:hypothetical protein